MDQISGKYPLVSVVTVNYNNAEVTCQLIDSLKKISYPHLEIIVVDNASAESPEIIYEKYPEVVFIRNTINKGFAGGNNDGFRVAKGKYFFMLNNDTEVEENFLEPLISMMEADPKIGVLSPKICYFHTPGIVQFAGGEGINLYTGRGKFVGKGQVDMGQFDLCKEIAHGHGAAMLISRQVMEEIGLLYEDYFLYYEELDYCERIKRAGYKIWYAGNSVVYHKESLSVGKESPLKIFYMTRNRLLFSQRNVQSFAFLVFLMFFLFASVPKNLFTYIKNRRPDLMKAFLKGIGAYLKVCLSSRVSV